VNDPIINKDIKAKILDECKHFLKEKISILISALNDVTEASNSESKSSAGDKHETGKAMMQIEQEKISKQLSELKSQKNELEKISLNTSATKIGPGSLIETNKGYFFIAVSIGKIKTNGKEIFVVSNLSPIGRSFIENKSGQKFELNNTIYEILNVF